MAQWLNCEAALAAVQVQFLTPTSGRTPAQEGTLAPDTHIWQKSSSKGDPGHQHSDVHIPPIIRKTGVGEMISG